MSAALQERTRPASASLFTGFVCAERAQGGLSYLVSLDLLKGLAGKGSSVELVCSWIPGRSRLQTCHRHMRTRSDTYTHSHSHAHTPKFTHAQRRVHITQGGVQGGACPRGKTATPAARPGAGPGRRLRPGRGGIGRRGAEASAARPRIDPAGCVFGWRLRRGLRLLRRLALPKCPGAA